MTKTVRVKHLRGHIDFAVITIREDEFEAVLRRFAPHSPVIDGRQIYEYACMTRPDGCSTTIAVVRTYEQGQTAAHSVARDVIDDLQPRWIVLVGIAGGVPDSEFSLGDVLLASSLHDFSITAAIEGEGPQFRPAGGPVHPAVERLLANLPAWRSRFGEWNQEAQLGRKKPEQVVPEDIQSDCFYGSDKTRETVRNSLQKHFPLSGVDRPPLYKIGAVASANVLLKDTTLLSEWRKVARHITHIEMEAGGVYAAARHGRAQEIPLLCVRGISDIVGFKRGAEWTQFACDVSASLLYTMVTTLLLEFFYKPTFRECLRNSGNKLVDGFFRWVTTLAQWRTRKAPTLEEIVVAFRKSSHVLVSRTVAPQHWIARSELGELEVPANENDASRVLFVLGSPGSGKTALLALFSKNAIDAGMATLAIKADILPREMPFDSWGRRELGLEISALDAVKVAATQSKVLVVIDQLDALASTVDLTSDRLNAVIDFVRLCSSIPNVRVVCSCRRFEFEHDVRFSSLNPKLIELELPVWNDVSAYLENRGIVGADKWKEPFREILRTPQHLQLFLNRYEATGKTDPFGSYYQMLDDLWARTIQTTAEQDFVYTLTDCLIEAEGLWVPLVRFERQRAIIDVLEAKGILQVEDRRVGFRHQTLLEYAKARFFTKEEKSLFTYVLEKRRQDSILIRPTIWVVLRYFRDAHPGKYQLEIESFFRASLRLHLRYLLIEFVGEFAKPEEYEIALLAESLLNKGDRIRVLIAIRGNPVWFNALRTSHFPVVMRGPVELQWPMVTVISDACDFAREQCLDLIEQNWLVDRQKDQLTWRALNEIEHWDVRAVEMVCTLIRYTRKSGDRLYWAESITSSISQDQPNLAPRVFIETVTRPVSTADTDDDDSKHRANSPIESSQAWYDLPAVAEAAPLEFLRVGWEWLVLICEQHHSGYCGSVLYQYGGSCFSLDQRDSRPQSPILTAFLTAIDATANDNPEEFVKITRVSWASENAVVHRLLARGLASVSHAYPDAGLRYLKGDRRRFWLGTHESDNQSDSIALICAVARGLLPEEYRGLEELILSWSMYRDEVDVSEEQKVWNREQRIPLIDSIAEFLSPQAADLLRSEQASFPDWNRKRGGLRYGSVRVIPPISKSEMLTASNDEVLRVIAASRNSANSERRSTEVEGGWEEPGGSHSAGLQIAELAKENPQRAIELIRLLVANGIHDAAAEPIHSLSETSLSDEEVFAFVRSIASFDLLSEQVRSNLGYLLHRRCRNHVGLPDDICEMLRVWLSMPFDLDDSAFLPSDSQNAEREPTTVTSILWSTSGGHFNYGRSFWPLLAVTHGYLTRSPAETTKWLDVVEEHLSRNISERTWTAYCSALGWIRLIGSDHKRGEATISLLFRRFPSLCLRQEGVRLLGHVSDLLSASFLRECLNSLRASTEFTSRQAFGELLTLIALRDENHGWARDWITSELAELTDFAQANEPIAVGVAFAAAHLWDEPQARTEASRLLCHLVPSVTNRTGQAIGTVFWAQQDFAADEATEQLLRAFAKHPQSFAKVETSDLIEHLAGLLPHKRELVLRVCQAILKSGREEYRLFEFGRNLVDIAMTLQRFSDTRDEGLALLEELLRLGLDDAFNILREIDIRPTPVARREPRIRRRRRRGGSA